MRKLILASASPRRKEILAMLGYEFEVEVSNEPETIDESLPLAEKIEKLAYHKAEVIARNHPHDIVLASDTVVVVDGEIIGKPHSTKSAIDMIKLIRNRSHEVITAITIMVDGQVINDYDSALVHFEDIPDEDIEEYVKTPEAYDKAGAYAVQGWAGKYISRIEGSFYTVMGLPLHMVYRYLKELM